MIAGGVKMSNNFDHTGYDKNLNTSETISLDLNTPNPFVQTSVPNENQTGELVAALAAAQLKFEPIKKTKKNPFFKSLYADLEDIISATQPALAAQGLVVIQKLTNDGKNVIVTTRLAHKSGQWIESVLSMPIGPKVDHQAIGTAATYGRRYSYQAIIGVAAELDDDGNANHTEEEKPEPKKKYEPKPGKVMDKVSVDQEYCFTKDGPKPVQGPEISGVPKAAIPPSVEVAPLTDRFPDKEEAKGFISRLRDYSTKVLPNLDVENPSDKLRAYVLRKSGVSETKLLTFKQFSDILSGLDSAFKAGRLTKEVEDEPQVSV
jgi:ERF superfamily